MHIGYVAKCGYSRMIAHSLLYGLYLSGGAGFICWEWLQGEGQIQTFMKHWRTNTQISKTLRIALAWYQHAAGAGFSLMQFPKIPVEYMDARWLPLLRKFLATIKGHMSMYRQGRFKEENVPWSVRYTVWQERMEQR